MPNVRIDENGLPKGPVYEPVAPVVHRSGVTAIDTSDPLESAGIDTAGYQECRFDLDVTGSGITNLEVQALFWNTRQSKWFGGGRRAFSGPGLYSLVVPCRGQKAFLKVTAFTGTSFTLNADYILS